MPRLRIGRAIVALSVVGGSCPLRRVRVWDRGIGGRGLEIAKIPTETSTSRALEAIAVTETPSVHCTEVLVTTVASSVHGMEALGAEVGAGGTCTKAHVATTRPLIDCRAALAAATSRAARCMGGAFGSRTRLPAVHGGLAASSIASVQPVPLVSAPARAARRQGSGLAPGKDASRSCAAGLDAGTTLYCVLPQRFLTRASLPHHATRAITLRRSPSLAARPVPPATT